MKKWVRKAIAAALSGALLLGASGMALADVTRETNSGLTNGGSSPSTTVNKVASPDDGTFGSFYLVKDYGVENTGITNSSPAEDFAFTITEYGVWNASGYNAGATGFPMLQAAKAGTGTADNASLTRRISAAIGDAGTGTVLKTPVYLPEYTTVGDYWYEVYETAGSNAGVTYTTTHYYIHVQVTENTSDTSASATGTHLVSNVTLHQTAPNKTTYNSNSAYNDSSTGYDKGYYDNNVTSGEKIYAIQNTYKAGSLSITKAVTGNAGDKNKRFQVDVVFTQPSGETVKSDIFFTAWTSETAGSNTSYFIMGDGSTATGYTGKTQYTDTGATWSANASSLKESKATIWVKDGDTVIFENIPYGVTYTVTETLPTGDTYTNSYQTDSNTSTETGDSNNGGSISDANDTITITNNKDVAIDIGVITEDTPYVAMMAVCAAAAVLMVARKKRIFED